MCYENERFEWLRREMEKVEELKQNTAPTPAKPAAPENAATNEAGFPASARYARLDLACAWRIATHQAGRRAGD